MMSVADTVTFYAGAKPETNRRCRGPGQAFEVCCDAASPIDMVLFITYVYYSVLYVVSCLF